MVKYKGYKDFKLNGKSFFYISIGLFIFILCFIGPLRETQIDKLHMNIYIMQGIKLLLVILSAWFCFQYFYIMGDNLAYYFSLVFLCYGAEYFTKELLIYIGAYRTNIVNLDAYISIGYLVKGFIILKACLKENKRKLKKQYIVTSISVIIISIFTSIVDLFLLNKHYLKITYNKYFAICFSIIAFNMVVFMVLSDRLRKDNNILHGIFIVIIMLININKIFAIFLHYNYSLMDLFGELILIIAFFLPLIGISYEIKAKIISFRKNNSWMKNVNHVLDKDKLMLIIIADNNKLIKYANDAARENGVTEGDNFFEKLLYFLDINNSAEIDFELDRKGYWNRKQLNNSGQNMTVSIRRLKDSNEKNIYYCTMIILKEEESDYVNSVVKTDALMSLHENIKDMVFVLNSKYIIQYVSPSIKAFMGYEGFQLMYKNMLSIIHPKDIAAFKALNKSIEESLFLEQRLLKNDGKYLLAEANVGLQRDGKNNLINIVLSYRTKNM